MPPIPPYEYPESPPAARSAPGDSPKQVPEQPKKSKPELKRPPHGPPPPKPFIEHVSPVAPVVPEKQPVQQVIMSHPETVTLPPVQDVVRQPEPSKSSMPEPSKNKPENARKSVPEKSSRRIPESIPKNSQTIPNHAQNEPEWKNAPEPENALNMPEIEDEGEVGRKRKYEDTGIYGDISVKDIVLFRHIKKRHWPDLSGDMKAWYEHFYFKRPTKREKPYRGRDYEQHKRAYERGQEWIAEHNASTASTQAVGSSGNTVIPFQKRASS